MAVHRPGSGDATGGDQVDRELGHLLVTIDDLQALLDMLNARSPDGWKIRFAGDGFVDDATDLRKLTESELSTLHVSPDPADAMIRFLPFQVTYSGPRDLLHDVATWANARRLKARWYHRKRHGPRAFPSILEMLLLSIMASTAFAAVAVEVDPLARLFGATFDPASRPGLRVFAIYMVVASLVLYWLSATRRITSRAVVVPRTREEYRDDRRSWRRQLVTWGLAATAVVVAAVGLLFR